MTVGTKSVLYGAHCFLLHPWFVARAWSKLYGFPWDPRLWASFFLHDLGYLGKPNMDGPEGETHVFLGAQIMACLFDHGEVHLRLYSPLVRFANWGISSFMNWIWGYQPEGTTWYCFTFYHSRFMAKRYGVTHTRLCVADKFSLTLEPWWLYLPRVRLTGEIEEYLEKSRSGAGKYSSNRLETERGGRVWFEEMKTYLRDWVREHRDLKTDHWTGNPDYRNYKTT